MSRRLVAVPGVLLIEAMAQTSGWLIIAINKFERMPFLASVRAAKLRRFVTPGERLALSAKLVHDGSGYAVTTASIEADGNVHSSSTKPPSSARKTRSPTAARIALPTAAPANAPTGGNAVPSATAR